MPEPVDGLLLVGPQLPAARVEVDAVRLAVDVAREVLGGPADLEQLLLEMAPLGGCTATVSSSMRVPSSGWIRLCRKISSSTGRSVVCRVSPWLGSFSSVSRP